jgi:hypothetical protein
MSLLTRGWSIYRSLPIIAAEGWSRKLYFGTTDGRVCTNTGYLDNVNLAVTSFSSIDCSLITAFRNMGNARQKQIQIIRPTIISESGSVALATEARYRYDLSEAGSPTAMPSNASNIWDTAIWDTAIVGRGLHHAADPRPERSAWGPMRLSPADSRQRRALCSSGSTWCLPRAKCSRRSETMRIFLAGAAMAVVLIVLGYANAARNSAGTMVAINGPFAAPNVISSAAINARLADIENELTNSVDKGGRTVMTAPLPLSNGTFALPSLTFGTDTDTGIYRIGANNLGVTAGGGKVLDVATTGWA